MVDPGSVSKSLYGLRSPILSSLPGMLYIYTPLSTCSHCLPELSHFHQWHHYCNIWRTGISIFLPHLHCKATTWSLAVIHPLPKHKTNIITSTQDNHCGVLARRTHCRAIKSVESTPLHLKTQRSGSKLSHTSPSQDSWLHQFPVVPPGSTDEPCPSGFTVLNPDSCHKTTSPNQARTYLRWVKSEGTTPLGSLWSPPLR